MHINIYLIEAQHFILHCRMYSIDYTEPFQSSNEKILLEAAQYVARVIAASLTANPIRSNPPPPANHTAPYIPCGAYLPIGSQTLFSHPQPTFCPPTLFFHWGFWGTYTSWQTFSGERQHDVSTTRCVDIVFGSVGSGRYVPV